MKSSVTVIIPTINRSSLVGALDSVIGQSFQGYEVIIVDDSKEQSVRCDNYKVLKTGGLAGVSRARNLGISMVGTEFTALLDDDDYWHPEYLEKQLENIADLGIDFGITGAMVNGRRRPNIPLRLGVDPFQLLYGKSHVFRSSAYLPTSAYLFRTQIIEKVQFDESITDRENLKFIWECFKNDYKICQNSQSLVTINYSSKNSLSRINVAQEIEWFHNLKNLNQDWSQNFLIESARNFLRIGDRVGAKTLLDQIDPKNRSLQEIILKLLAQ